MAVNQNVFNQLTGKQPVKTVMPFTGPVYIPKKTVSAPMSKTELNKKIEQIVQNKQPIYDGSIKTKDAPVSFKAAPVQGSLIGKLSSGITNATNFITNPLGYVAQKTLEKPLNAVIGSQLEPVKERLNSVVESVKTKSLAPLKTSFAKQYETQYKTNFGVLPRSLNDDEKKNLDEVMQGKAVPVNDVVVQAVKNREGIAKTANIALMANLDTGLLGKKSVKGTPLPPEVKTSTLGRERGFVSSVKEAVPEVKIDSRITTRNTENLAIKAKNLVKEDIVTAEKIAAGTDDKAVATTSELIKHYNNLAKTAKTTAEKNIYLDKIAVVANETAKNLTDAGRTVQAASILNMQTPEGNLRFASGLIQKYNDLIDKKGTGLLGLRKKIPELTGVQAQEILNESKRIFAMSEGEVKAMAFQQLQNKISALIPSSAYKQVVSVWKAGLLTGLKTTGTNIFANLSHGLTETIKDVPAVIVDKIASLITGKRTLGLTLKGSKEGIAEGFKKGATYLKTGYDERNIAQKLDYNKVNISPKLGVAGKAIQKYEDGIFRLLGAEDQPFYYGAKARSLYSQAIAEAKNIGVKGAERTKFIEELVANPTPKMLEYAVHDAEMAVFQNKTLLGKAAKGLQNVPGGEVIVPFGRTPAAVATQIINYSPAGIVKTIVENLGKGKFDQRMFSQGIGRGITGTGAVFIGMQLFKHDRISLGYPKDEKEKRLWELEGRKPNSIKINGKWRSVAILGPIGIVLITGAYLQNGLNKTGSWFSGIEQAGLGGFKSVTEQTFLQGLNQFTSAIGDPQGYGPGLVGNLIGSAIPTLISDTAQATDKLQRKSSATKDGFLAPLQARTPFARNKLEPKINAFGDQIKRPGNVWETFLDPTRPSNVFTGPVTIELRRLSDTGNLATPTYFADDKKINVSPKEKTQLQQRAGNLFRDKVEHLIGSDEYSSLSDEDKAKKILDFADRSRIQARVEYINQRVHGLNGNDLKNELKELKENGVMNKEVFTKWNKGN